MGHRLFVFFVFALAWMTIGSAFAEPPPAERARLLFQEGVRAYEAGRLPEAAEKLVAAHRLTPLPELAFNLGRVFERMGDTEKAIRYFRLYQKTLGSDAPEHAEITRRIADLEALAKRQRDQVFTAPPSEGELMAEARAFFLRGVAMFKRKNFEAALQAFQAAFRFAPLPEVAFNLAVTAERLGRTPEAIEFYREYVRLRPNAPDREAVERNVEAMRARERK